MNKMIIAIIALALVATPALALSTSVPADIRVGLSTAGFTTFKEQDTVYGVDTYMPANGDTTNPQATAYVLENVRNFGTLDLTKQVSDGTTIQGNSNWGMQEDENLLGTGSTTIDKQVVWWTVDTHQTGSDLTYPTIANIYTDTVAQDPKGAIESETSISNVANQPPAMTPNVYTLNSKTTVPVSLTESVGINMPTRCAVLPPKAPKAPTCLGCARLG